ncbi:MAG: hypothetical protein GQ567_06970 [Methanosarcinales archaeon]|nr:hypothetical protein [Methanosarcinales archaeon]
MIQQNKSAEPTLDESLVYLSDPIRDVLGAGTGRSMGRTSQGRTLTITNERY